MDYSLRKICLIFKEIMKNPKSHEYHTFDRYYINQLEKLGLISKVKNGLYKLGDYDFQYNFELVDVFKIVPIWVMYLTSALAYYDLTTYNPWQ